jgi:hypothetical protein
VASPDLSLLAFACGEYERRAWDMPAVHVRIYDWLARTDGTRNRVLQVFRGCGKSTILGIRNAHKYRANPLHQLLVQGADDDLADDISRDTISIMRGNPLMPEALLVEPAGVRHWFTRQGFESNARTPQYRGRGILSRVTGNRADEIINDDTEMAKNVETPEARAKLRKRLSEQSFILKPGGSVLWVGTPHTHDSIYDQKIAAGADALVIPLFAHQTRHDASDKAHQRLRFTGEPGPDGLWVFVGIGKDAQLLAEGADYTVAGQVVTLRQPVAALVDVCHGNAWPERFTRAEMLERRRECETLNYWDQQYQLQAKAMKSSRLNPGLLIPYEVAPRFETRNRKPVMLLGDVQIVGATVQWDPSSAKPGSDVSALAVMLFDEFGNRYWHKALALAGEVAEYDEAGKVIIGGQVAQIAEAVKALQLRRVVVETNGAGTFAPAVLKACMKQRGVHCGVTSLHETRNKNRTILEAMEGPLVSGKLWAHVDVVAAVSEQMRDWKPDVTQQPDDFLDSAAKALVQAPERVGGTVRTFTEAPANDWRPSAGVFEAELEI